MATIMSIKYITIGSDPEFAAVNEHGAPTSVIGLLPGTKKEPFELGEGVSCQVDCTGAETCIPPCTSRDEFVHFIELSKVLTTQKLQEKAPNLSLVSLSSRTLNTHITSSNIKSNSKKSFHTMFFNFSPIDRLIEKRIFLQHPN